MATKQRRKAMPSQVPNGGEEILTVASTPRAKALVFLSHDSRDADLAEAFANLLSDVSAGTLKSFRSSDKRGSSGIEFGAEWYATIMSQLDQATDVVALLTAQSIDRPWILYEAGVAKGKLETTVFGIALGVPLEKVSTGPFGQFQNCGDDEDSLTKLVMQLLQRNPDAAPREEAVKTQVRVFREIANQLLEKRGKSKVSEVSAPEENVAKLFEEVKAMVRELPERVDERVASISRRANRRRIHPGMIEDLLFRPFREKDEASAAWLIFLSVIRDDVPWLHEPGIDFYHALKSGRRAEVLKAGESLLRMVRLTHNSKILYRIARNEGEEPFFLTRHMDDFVGRMIRESALLADEAGDAGPGRASKRRSKVKA